MLKLWIDWEAPLTTSCPQRFEHGCDWCPSGFTDSLAEDLCKCDPLAGEGCVPPFAAKRVEILDIVLHHNYYHYYYCYQLCLDDELQMGTQIRRLYLVYTLQRQIASW